MTAFGSRCEKGAPAFENSLIIATSNSMFSFISGLCIFGLLGYLSHLEGNVTLDAGPAFLFGAYPAALSKVPLGLHLMRFLFLNFILLGLNSAFAMVEVIVLAIQDSIYNTLSKAQVTVIICTVGFLCGLVYTTDTALHFLDVVNFYLNFIVLFLGFCKAFSAGWMYGIQKQIKLLGYNLVYTYLLSTFGSVSLASLVWFGVGGNTVVLGFVCFFTMYGMGIGYCYYRLDRLQMPDEGHTIKTLSEELIMGNILDLKAELEGSVGYIPYAWALLMKHAIPQILLTLLFNLAFARTEGGKWDFGHYGDYRLWPFQSVGLVCVILVVLIIAVGLVQARLFDGVAGDLKSLSHTDSFEMVKKEEDTDYVNMTEIENGTQYPGEQSQTAEEAESPILVLT